MKSSASDKFVVISPRVDSIQYIQAAKNDRPTAFNYDDKAKIPKVMYRDQMKYSPGDKYLDVSVVLGCRTADIGGLQLLPEVTRNLTKNDCGHCGLKIGSRPEGERVKARVTRPSGLKNIPEIQMRWPICNRCDRFGGRNTYLPLFDRKDGELHPLKPTVKMEGVAFFFVEV